VVIDGYLNSEGKIIQIPILIKQKKSVEASLRTCALRKSKQSAFAIFCKQLVWAYTTVGIPAVRPLNSCEHFKTVVINESDINDSGKIIAANGLLPMTFMETISG
jgi:hypothetical protein